MANVVLKTSEGLVDTVDALLGDQLQGTFPSQVGCLLSRRAFRRFHLRLVGRALILHGHWFAKAVCNAITMTQGVAPSDVIERVEREIATSGATDL